MYSIHRPSTAVAKPNSQALIHPKVTSRFYTNRRRAKTAHGNLKLFHFSLGGTFPMMLLFMFFLSPAPGRRDPLGQVEADEVVGRVQIARLQRARPGGSCALNTGREMAGACWRPCCDGFCSRRRSSLTWRALSFGLFFDKMGDIAFLTLTYSCRYAAGSAPPGRNLCGSGAVSVVLWYGCKHWWWLDSNCFEKLF